MAYMEVHNIYNSAAWFNQPLDWQTGLFHKFIGRWKRKCTQCYGRNFKFCSSGRRIRAWKYTTPKESNRLYKCSTAL